MVVQRAHDVGPRLVQLEMEHDRRIEVAFAFDDVGVAIDAHEITRRHLAPEATDARDDDRAVFAVAHADVPGELVVVALGGERATDDRELLSIGQRSHRSPPGSIYRA